MPDIVDPTKRQSAYQPLSGARKLVIKNVRSPAHQEARIREYYARTERELDGALDAIFNGRAPAIPLERLYRGVEDLCRKGNADTVYRTLKDKVDGHLKNVVLPKIQSAVRISGLDVLRSTLAEWKTWNAQTVWLFPLWRRELDIMNSIAHTFDARSSSDRPLAIWTAHICSSSLYRP